MTRTVFAFFVLLNALFVLTSTGRVRTTDEYMALFQAESLALRGTTAVPQAVAVGHFYGKYDRAGEPRAPYAPGHAILATPWYALGRGVLARAPGVPAGAIDLVLGFAATLSSATFAAAAAAIALALLLRLGYGEGVALGAAATLALGMPLFAYSGWFYSEPLGAAALLGAAFALFGGPRGEPLSLARAAAGGAILGAAILVRPAHAIATPVFLAGVLFRDGRRGLAPAAVAGGAAGALLCLYLSDNARLFGSPFDFGYPETVEGGKRANAFDTPLLYGLAGFLLSPGKSIFLYAPPAIAAILGVRALAARDRGLALVAGALPVVYLLFYARFASWEGGYCYGPRYLVPPLALLALGVAPLLAEGCARPRRVVLALAIAGALVQAIGLGTSFLEDQRHGGYYDEALRYDPMHCSIVTQGRLLAHYLVASEPAPLGKGLDRWFLFLAKGGVSPVTLAVAAAAAALVAAGAAVVLARSYRGGASGGGNAPMGGASPGAGGAAQGNL